MPIHKRIAKEKFRKSYDINEMLDHLFDLFHHIGKDLTNANFTSVTKGCKKTIMKFSKKLKNMIKTKGDFYLPESRSRSKGISPSPDDRKGSINTAISEVKSNNDALEYKSNEIVMNNDQLEECKILSV